MKIIIGRCPTYSSCGGDYPSAPTAPHEIRAWVAFQMSRPQESQDKIVIYTLDRTLLDEVTENGPISYENISVQRADGTEVPLLSLHPVEYLSHFHLGDVYSRKSEAWMVPG